MRLITINRHHYVNYFCKCEWCVQKTTFYCFLTLTWPANFAFVPYFKSNIIHFTNCIIACEFTLWTGEPLRYVKEVWQGAKWERSLWGLLSRPAKRAVQHPGIHLWSQTGFWWEIWSSEWQRRMERHGAGTYRSCEWSPMMLYKDVQSLSIILSKCSLCRWPSAFPLHFSLDITI